MVNGVIYQLAIAFLLGAFIGLERQIQRKSELGLRTFALTTSLGAISGIIYFHNPAFFLVISIAFIFLTFGYYVFDCLTSKDIGITTEIALIYSYIIGVLITTNILSIPIVIGITVILGLVLSRKEFIQKYVSGVEKEQMASFISYLVIALVILPLLPNVSYRFSDIPNFFELLNSYGIKISSSFAAIEIINPFKLWLVVALITGVDVAGFILENTVGQKKGWLLTSFAGGFVSSTATTGSLAMQSKNSVRVNHLVGAAIVANMASFLQEAILILPLSLVLFSKIMPSILLMLISSLMVAIFFLYKDRAGENFQATREGLKKTKLFYLYPALKFAALFVFIKLFAQIALVIFGNSGFFVAMVLGAIPGVDAVLVSIAEFAGKTVSYNSAIWVFILVNLVNLSVKSFYSLMNGKKEFAVKFISGAVIIVISSMFGLFFVV